MKDSTRIPFNKPFIVGREMEYIPDAVSRGQLAGGGHYTRACQAWMESHFNASQVLLTHSCTAALEMAVMLAGIGPGDEVILPSYTFVSTANAVVLRGGIPVWCDIRPDTLNMDEALVEGLVTPRTKAIIAVHYSGVACEMDTLLAIARRHGLLLIEDAAQGVNATYKGKFLGTLGDLGCYSFHETKNVISGQGGALLVNTPAFAERAEILRDRGTNRAKFFQGEVDKYTWVDLGFSHGSSELIAAFLYAQLEHTEEITAKRRGIHAAYWESLADLEHQGQLRRPRVPKGCVHNGHMFYILVGEPETRNELMAHLQTSGVHSVFHYVPLHSSPAGRHFTPQPRPLPVTEDLAERLIRLPCYYEMSPEAVRHVVSCIQDFFARPEPRTEV